MSRITQTILEDFKEAGIEVDDPFGPWPARIALIVLVTGVALTLIVGGAFRFVIGLIFQVLP